MPFDFPAEKLPTEDQEKDMPTRVNLIDDIINKHKKTIVSSSRDVSGRDVSERNNLMMSSALGVTDVDFELCDIQVK